MHCKFLPGQYLIQNPYWTNITLENKTLILIHESFQKRCLLFTVGNVYPENSSPEIRFRLPDPKKNFANIPPKNPKI
jgi:hypothetical protein